MTTTKNKDIAFIDFSSNEIHYKPSSRFPQARFYDSHVHWMATGLNQLQKNLLDLKSPQKVYFNPSSLNLRGDFVFAFGWNENNWPDHRGKLPTKELLDSFWPHTPVYFIRQDGHAAWVNSEALKRAGVSAHTPDPPGGRIVRMSPQTAEPSGVLIDTAMELVERLIPPYKDEQIRTALIAGQEYFLQRDFLFIRDMQGNRSIFNEALKLYQQQELELYVQMNFDFYGITDLDRAIAEALEARQSETEKLKVAGIKFYIDGALGSEGALLLSPYKSGGGSGLQLYSFDEICFILTKAWSLPQPLAVSVHALGDGASLLLAKAASQLRFEKNIRGPLNIEHCEMMSLECIEMLAKMVQAGQKVTCHMQPSHFLSDSPWLKEKLSDNLNHLFPWWEISKRNIPLFFGSDSPIEVPGLDITKEALEKAAEFTPIIKKPSQDFVTYHLPPELW